MEERVRLRKEEQAKTVLDRVKERFTKAADGVRKGAEGLAKGIKEGKNLKDIAKKVQKDLTPEETAMQQARRERLDRQRKEEAALKRKAFLGDKAAKQLLLERKLQRFSYSVMSNQKWAFNLKVRVRDPHKYHQNNNNDYIASTRCVCMCVCVCRNFCS